MNLSKIPIFLRRLSIEPSLILISWFLLLCETFNVSIYYWECVIVFTSTWLGYSADRYFEPSPKKDILSDRHLIFKQEDKIFKIIWSLTLILTSVLSIYFLNNLQLLLLTLLFTSTYICLFIAYQEAILECKFLFLKEFRTAYILSMTTIFFFTFKISTHDLKHFLSFIFFFLLYLNNLCYTNIYDLSYDQKLKRASPLQESREILSASLRISIASVLVMIPVLVIFETIILMIAAIIVLLISYLLYYNKLKKSLQIDTIYWIVPLFLYSTLKIYHEI